MKEANPELLHLTTEELCDEILARSVNACLLHINAEERQKNEGFNILRKGSPVDLLWMVKRVEVMLIHEDIEHDD